ncbi:hypothetical protein OS493_006168 [Desmophyllum pertusum]|uniref:Uncharacterized protein n=1 Tax=Desmophyllum pertusum TaxID=174260 RepID=A0A9X0A543_9CNID|nr:hypothetical protein OS493_006168 [Desmophyllum pertusum]
MSIGNSENSGGDMAALSVNPNCDGLSAQTEPRAEEHTGGPDSSNGVFVPNESGSSAVGSSELSASSALIPQPLRVDSNSSSSTSHDALLDGDMSVGQNGSGAFGGDGKDSTVDQTVSDLSTQANKWERLGARPRDRPQTIFPEESSLAGSVAQGLAGAFLARHSQNESFYQGSAEQVLPDDTSSQGASYVDEPNKAMPYFGDCQVASRPDAHSRSLLPLLSLTGGGYDRRNAEGGYAYNEQFNANNGLVPGASPSYFRGNNFLVNGTFPSSSTFNTSNCALLALEQRVEEACAMVERAVREREEWELFGREIEKKERKFRELRARKRREREARELEEASRWPQEQEAITGRGRSQWRPRCEHYRMQLPCSPTTESLESNPSSAAELCQRVAKARAKIQEREGAARSIEDANRRWCTCEEESEEELNPICRRCCKHRYLGPACLSRHDNCCCYLQIGEDSGKCRSCGGNVSAGVSRLVAGANTEPHGAEASLPSANSGGSMLNRDVGTGTVESTDNSLLALEQRVEEACAMVEKVLRERDEREQFGREIEKKEREIRELRARKRREREARELEEARRWPQQQEAITGRERLQIGEDSGKCRSCGGNMSAYFCSICKHFTSVDKNPYHCEKCGICRIHEDKSFHCDVCKVCLDKRLEGKHKSRPDSGHDECCICLEDAFSGCQILPCSHKVHRECAIAMIQNGIRTCPVCRHPFYIPASE